MKKLAILLIGVTMVFMSCKKDLDKPTINQFPENNVWTVGQLLTALEEGTYTFEEDAIVKGYVIADETGGNIYRTLYLRGEDGKCIAMYRPKGDDFAAKVGNHIGFKLYGSILGSYSGLPQIQIQDENYNSLFVIYEKECLDKVQPRELTANSAQSDDYLCDLVKLSDMQFMPYANCNYYDPNNSQGNATGRKVMSCSETVRNLVVRTSQYASFAEDPLPAGNGTIVAIMTKYVRNGGDVDWQLLVRNTNDVKMDNSRCGGEGTRENPFTTNDVISMEVNDGTTSYWVKDYVVGFVDENYNYVFSTENSVKTNIVLSSNIDAASEEECIPIQLPAGEIRNGLNLSDHPENHKQEVLLYGTLEKYFQVYGVKNVSYAEINGNSYGEEPGGEVIFSEPFASSQGDFEIVDVNLGGLNYVWEFSSQYSCMKASAYSGHAYESESWLISPAIDLSAVSTAKLSFSHACKYETNPQQEMTVWLTSNYTGDVATTEWTQVVLNEYGSNFTFINSGSIDLSQFVGGNVYVAFKYVSTSSNASTWEVRNVVVKE